MVSGKHRSNPEVKNDCTLVSPDCKHIYLLPDSGLNRHEVIHSRRVGTSKQKIKRKVIDVQGSPTQPVFVLSPDTFSKKMILDIKSKPTS